MTGAGTSIANAIRSTGVTEVTYYRTFRVSWHLRASCLCGARAEVRTIASVITT